MYSKEQQREHKGLLMTIVMTLNPDAVEIHHEGRVMGTIRRDWPGTNGWTLVVPSQDGATAISYDVMSVALKFIEDKNDWK